MSCLRHRTHQIRTHYWKPLYPLSDKIVLDDTVQHQDELDQIEAIDKDIAYEDLEDDIREKVDRHTTCSCEGDELLRDILIDLDEVLRKLGKS